MKFSRGDLVRLSPLSGGMAELSASPLAFSIDKLNTTGYLLDDDIAVVVAFDKRDCSTVFVLSTRGAGWVVGAFLKKIT
jgi:hypothetical protein